MKERETFLSVTVFFKCAEFYSEVTVFLKALNITLNYFVVGKRNRIHVPHVRSVSGPDYVGCFRKNCR